jgi:hypothetical protein
MILSKHRMQNKVSLRSDDDNLDILVLGYISVQNGPDYAFIPYRNVLIPKLHTGTYQHRRMLYPFIFFHFSDGVSLFCF